MLSKTELLHRSTPLMDALDGKVYTCSWEWTKFLSRKIFAVSQKRVRSPENAYTLILSALTKRTLKSVQPQCH